MGVIKPTEKTKFSLENFERIYQYADGTYLPDSSQPNSDAEYEITSEKYTPHNSTRYINVIIGTNGKAQRKDQSGNMVDSDQDLPEVYTAKENCCGCTACYAICPVQAIMMRPDEEGFLYPVIDAEKCMRCYKCLTVCPCKKSWKGKVS